MPQRQVMIDKYLEGKLPTLDEIPLEKHKPTLVEKMRGYFDKSKEAPTGDASSTAARAARHLVGILFRHRRLPADRAHHDLAALVEGPRQHRQADRRSMAKYTLASNAARDMELLSMLKRASKRKARMRSSTR